MANSGIVGEKRNTGLVLRAFCSTACEHPTALQQFRTLESSRLDAATCVNNQRQTYFCQSISTAMCGSANTAGHLQQQPN